MLILEVNIASALCSSLPHLFKEGELIRTSPAADSVFLCTARDESSLVSRPLPVPLKVTACVLVVILLFLVEEPANLFVIAK